MTHSKTSSALLAALERWSDTGCDKSGLLHREVRSLKQDELLDVAQQVVFFCKVIHQTMIP